MRITLDAIKKSGAKAAVAFLLSAAVMLPAGVSSAAEDTMKLIASPASQAKAAAFVGLMKTNQITVDAVAPADAAAAKKSNVVVIEGGMDDAAIKPLITEVAGASEAAALAKAGAKKMIMKENVWQPGQKVLVFAGSNADAAAAARTENREEWMKYFKQWFELSDGPEGLKGY